MRPQLPLGYAECIITLTTAAKYDRYESGAPSDAYRKHIASHNGRKVIPL